MGRWRGRGGWRCRHHRRGKLCVMGKFLAMIFVERGWGERDGVIPFGWNMGVLKVIFGGRCGYSGGNMR